MKPVAILLLAACLAGCVSERLIPWELDREVVDSIPPETARKALRDVLGRAYVPVEYNRPFWHYLVGYYPNPFEGHWQPCHRVEVDDAGFLVTSSANTWRYQYALLEPTAATYTNTEWSGVILVRLTPGEVTDWHSSAAEASVIAFRSGREDVMTLFDALASLARATAP